MKILIIDIFLGSMVLYVIIGMLFSIFFYSKGGIYIDEGIKNVSWHFKLIIFPGVVLFWCILLVKIIRKI